MQPVRPSPAYSLIITSATMDLSLSSKKLFIAAIFSYIIQPSSIQPALIDFPTLNFLMATLSLTSSPQPTADLPTFMFPLAQTSTNISPQPKSWDTSINLFLLERHAQVFKWKCFES